MKLSLDGVKTLIKISVRDLLTLLIFAVEWALCGRQQPKYESVMPLLSLSSLNVLTQTLSSVRKVVCFLFNNQYNGDVLISVYLENFCSFSFSCITP